MNLILPTNDPLDEAFGVLNHRLSSREAAGAQGEVPARAMANREALLRFGAEGPSWTRAEVNAFVDGLAKLP